MSGGLSRQQAVFFWGMVVFVALLAYHKMGKSGPSASPTVDLSKLAASVGAISKPADSFKTDDAAIETNGNLLVAMNKINSMPPEAVWQSATKTSATKLKKNLYSSIGKAWKLSGTLSQVQEAPPNLSHKGHWSEVLIIESNPNAPLDFTTISFFYNGDTTSLNVGDEIVVAGFLAGTYTTMNMMGGVVQGMSIVGNSFRVAK
ncbi:MAG: hypothetical protein HY927_06100 [Elusimicrobia bacterium]|nr:hypothetical protein [Elusimicrobiota bacterium]